MKKVFKILIAIIVGISLNQDLSAQSESYEKGFGGVQFNWSRLAGTNTIEGGGYGAKYLNQHLYLGGGGFGMDVEIDELEMDLGYGGILIGYVINPNQRFQFSFGLLTGIGGLTIGENGTEDYEEAVGILKPSVELDMRISNIVRIGVFSNYRAAIGVSSSQFSNGDISGLGSGISLKFGNFYSNNK